MTSRELASTGRIPVTTDPQVLVAVDLRKSYEGREVVKGISVEVNNGEVIGVLGPNGAGKSTTIRMIGCTSPPSSGTLKILGLNASKDGARIRGMLGVVPQTDNLDTEISVLQNLVVYGTYFGMRRSEARVRAGELLEFVQLKDREAANVESLSGGMKRRLTIARALINKPRLLLLDEPTTGLDPQARHVVWERLYSLKDQGVSQILTTHYMDEAEQLCDRIYIMNDGKVVAQGAPSSLVQRFAGKEVVELRLDGNGGEQSELLNRVSERIEILPDRALLYVQDGDDALNHLIGAGLRPRGSVVRRASLEDVFLRLTGRTLVD